MMIKLVRSAIALGALMACTAPAAAEVTRAEDDSFVSRHEVVVKATPKEVWLALISPEGWWHEEHTWSGDAKNLTLMPKAGGCFCETIPEVDEPGRFTLEGSVEHMRVVQAYPEQALRMVGALGPLQSEPVTGVLTIAISKTDEGTRIVWEYNVGGPMRYEVPVISKAVDGVMGAQLAALAKPLKVIASAAPASSPVGAAPAGAALAKPAAAPGKGGSGSGSESGARSAPGAAAKATPTPEIKPASKTTPAIANPVAAPPAAAKPAPKAPSVEDAFGDLDDKSPR